MVGSHPVSIRIRCAAILTFTSVVISCLADKKYSFFALNTSRRSRLETLNWFEYHIPVDFTKFGFDLF